MVPDAGDVVVSNKKDGSPALPGRREQFSTRVVFFIAGFGMAAWAPLVPFAKERTGVNDASLGMLLLFLGVGSLVSMPLAGVLAARYGCRRSLVAAVLVMCGTLPLLAWLSPLAGVAAALFAFGAGVGATDCVVNIQAVMVERASGRQLMSGFHGLFSVGGIAGAAGVSGLLALGMEPVAAVMVAVGLMVVALLAVRKDLLPYGEAGGEGSGFVFPRGVVLLMGVLCFVVFLAEGAMLDWSALFLTEVRGMKAEHSGLGYAAFAATMTLGRLAGDGVVRRLGHTVIVAAGGVCAAAGLALAISVGSWQAALIGFALVGLGCSNIVPVMFSLIGKQTVMPPGVAVPVVSTMGYSGILLGPAFIGFVAQRTGLPLALAVVACALVGVAMCARRLGRAL